MKLIYIFMVIILGLILFGCGSNEKSVEDITGDVIEENKSQEEVVLNICGNGMCETNEGCNEITQETRCKEDCGLNCEAKIFLLSERCDGVCNKGLNSFEFIDLGRIKFTLKNLGEKDLEDLKADLECKFNSGKVEYESYFEGKENNIKLNSGETTYYYIEVKDSSNFDLTCDLVFRGGYSVVFDKVRLKRF